MASSDEANGLLDEPGPAPTHSMKHDDLIKPDEQGLWYRNSRDYWPVLVLRNDLVPDRIREDPCEDKVPVFLINKNDIEYVKRSSVHRRDRDGFLRALTTISFEENEDLHTALLMAHEERGPLSYLQDMRRDWGTVTTSWDVEQEKTKRRAGQEHGTTSESANMNSKRRRDTTEPPLGGHSYALRSKRQKSDPDVDSEAVAFTEDLDNELNNQGPKSLQDIQPVRNKKWSAEEDAELIRIKENIMPDAPWEDVLDAFYDRFADSTRSRSAIRSRYLNYLHPDAVGVIDVPSSINTCTRMRVRALKVLEQDACASHRRHRTDRSSFKRKSADQEDRVEVEPVQHWTAAEDAELVKLKEQNKLPLQTASVLFQKRWLLSGRSLREIRRRYNYFLREGAFGENGNVSEQEDCAVLRGIALSLLEPTTDLPANRDHRDADDDLDALDLAPGQRWSTIQDAHLLYLREKREETYEVISDLLNIAFPDFERSKGAVRERYRSYLQAEAWFKGRGKSQSLCDRLRAQALSLQDYVETSIYDELEGAEIDKQDALTTGKAIGGRDLPRLAEIQVDHEIARNDDIPEHPDFDNSSCRKWTAEEDAHLVRLREVHMKESSWLDRHATWMKVLPKCPRTQKSLESRYRYVLVQGASGNVSSTVGKKECAELRDRALAYYLQLGENKALSLHLKDEFGRLWSAKEDAVLLHLREYVVREANWKTISRKLKRKLPGSNRTAGAVSERYRKFLALDAIGDSRSGDKDCVEMRKRAINTLSNLDTSSDNETSSTPDDPVVSQVSRRYTAAEDAEIIRLKERVGYQLQWPAILEAFKQKFPECERSYVSLKDRYGRILMKDAIGSFDTSDGYCEHMRRRALEYLDSTTRRQQQRQQADQKPKPTIVSLLSDDEDNDSDMACIQNEDDTEDDDEDDDIGSQEKLTHRKTRFDRNKTEEHNQARDTIDEIDSDDEIGGGDTLTFLIGRDHEQFRVPVSRVLSNAYIIEDTVEDNILGAVVTGARWSRLTVDAFRPIYQYLKHGDYRPYTKTGQLIGLSDSDDAHAREVVRCGSVFNLARELQLEELMGTICQKFMLLRKQPLAVMMATRIMYRADTDATKNEMLMRRILIDEIGGNYQSYMEAYPKNVFKQDERTPGFSHKVILKHLASSGGKPRDGEGW